MARTVNLRFGEVPAINYTNLANDSAGLTDFTSPTLISAKDDLGLTDSASTLWTPGGFQAITQDDRLGMHDVITTTRPAYTFNNPLGITDVATPGLVFGGGPTIPAGYTLGVGSRGTSGKVWDLTRDEGWYHYDGVTISAAYYLAGNVTFGPTGMRIRCTRAATNGSAYSSGQAHWGSTKLKGPGVIGDEFYIRYVAKMEQPLILGDFPAFLWARAQTGDGNGEIDFHETMANHIAGVPVLDGGAGASNPTQQANKVTLIKTPYDTNQVNYSLPETETAVGSTRLNLVETPHVFEIYKTLTDMTSYIDGVLMTRHVRGGVGGSPSGYNSTGMTNTIWDSQFAAGKMWDLRVCYQYGDITGHTGNAGRPQPFNGDRYLNLSELLVAVPV